jgi:ATP-binding cassette, subfamily B, bacterial
MSTNAIKKPAARPSLLRLLALLKPKQGKYMLGLAGRVAISTTERLVIAIIAKNAIEAITSSDLPLFKNTMIGFALFYLGYLIIAPFVLYLWHSAIAEGTAAVRESVFRHLQRLPLGYHELHHSGDALSILTNDVSAAEKAYQEDLLRLFEASAQGITAVVFMFVLSWQLALLILASSVMPLMINTLFAKPLREIGDAVQKNLGGLSERMTDLLAGYAVVRTFNLGEWILARFEQANGQVQNSSLRRVRTEAALAGANDFTGLFTTAPMILGAYLVLTGQTTFGILVGLIQISNNVNYFVYSIGGTISRIQAALAAADRVLGLLDEPLEPETYHGQVAALPANAGRRAAASTAMITFDKVDFAYNGGPNILNGLSFVVEPGQMVAFAGPSGGGKSTIFKLLLGCYPPKGGEIQVSQRALTQTRLNELRSHFAYVPQDAYLFSGTVFENIRYGKPEASEAEIMAAARAAFAHDFICEFPNGYQTVVGEHGARLSGGQRQRISIARALLKDAPILLLDEATSALDSESEQIVQQALEVLMRGRTTLVIAHRLSTILNADQIYVVDGGRVAEAGRHAELVEKKGIYAGLVELQYRLAEA